jgi:hypothetical protein
MAPINTNYYRIYNAVHAGYTRWAPKAGITSLGDAVGDAIGDAVGDTLSAFISVW